MVMLHKHGSDVTLIEDVATLAHVVKLRRWGGVGLTTFLGI